ncbi:MAG: J domain-containing protein [Alphaproteobacteria bacterium]|nr:J domain-containing protein [Alphaproteobacteria bacterium]MCB9696765.1 J domain-containing protein [Alphaproteobacteria bacterium]
MPPTDAERLVVWLRASDASETLLAVVCGQVHDEGNLPWEDRELWLAGRLLLATEAAVEGRALDAVRALSRTLGFSADDWDALVRARLGITPVRLRAYATLCLPLHATAAEIREVHRAVVKQLHPDRHPEAQRDEATRRLGRVNRARDVLLSPRDEVDLFGEDDLWLDEPIPDESTTDLGDLLEREG